jgi:hypothetical protein
MKKLHTIVALIILSSILLKTEVMAQNIPLACQGEKAGGLDWENGKWVIKGFYTSKFVLVKNKTNLTTESVAKAIRNPYPDLITCVNGSPEIVCYDMGGSIMYFNPTTLKGGIAQLFGATTDKSNKDTVGVEVFSCTPF